MLIHSHRHFVSVLVAIFQCCAISAYAADSTTVNATACLDRDNLSNKLSPFDLYKSIASCIASENFEPAVFMYAMAGAFGRFDTLRVADKSAHQATKVLPMLTFGSLPKDKVSAFQARVRKTFGDDSTRGQYCAEIERIGPPDYFPSYMLQHGMGAFTGANGKQPFVVPFDAKAAWPRAVKDYLQCPQP